MKNNYFLVGFSGIGKTTTGLSFAKENQMNFVSQDYLVEKIINMPIKDYLNKHGHIKLKKVFDNILKELIMICSNTIIDCGGAVSQNIDLKNQQVIYLKGTPELILNRYKQEDINDKNRFAKYLDKENFLRIYEKKEKEYSQIATYTINISETDSIEDVILKIKEIVF